MAPVTPIRTPLASKFDTGEVYRGGFGLNEDFTVCADCEPFAEPESSKIFFRIDAPFGRLGIRGRRGDINVGAYGWRR